MWQCRYKVNSGEHLEAAFTQYIESTLLCKSSTFTIGYVAKPHTMNKKWLIELKTFGDINNG